MYVILWFPRLELILVFFDTRIGPVNSQELSLNFYLTNWNQENL